MVPGSCRLRPENTSSRPMVGAYANKGAPTVGAEADSWCILVYEGNLKIFESLYAIMLSSNSTFNFLPFTFHFVTIFFWLLGTT